MLEAVQYEVPPGPPDPGELRGLAALLRSLCEQAARDRTITGEALDYLDLTARELTVAVRQYALCAARSGAERAAVLAEGFEAGRASVLAGRHRMPRQRAGQGKFWPRAVPGVALPAGLAKTLGLGAAAATIAAGTAAGVAGVSHASGGHAPSARRAAVFAGVSPVDAMPLAVPVPGYGYQGRHRAPAADADSASPVAVISLPVVMSPPSPPPSARSSAAAGGRINAQTVQVTLGPSGQGEITFWAEGGDVTWSAWSSLPLSVTVTDDTGLASGVLAAGAGLTLTVTLLPGAAMSGQAVITLDDGSGNPVQVPVTWAGILAPPA